MKHTLICLDGTDGCGKKTQADLLAKHFQNIGRAVLLLDFPNYQSPSSGPVKMYLGGDFGDKADCLDAYQASTLYAVDRLCTMRRIMAELKVPTVIILDRYVSSNMIHQASKIKDRRALNKLLKWIDRFEFETLKLPRPDKVLFLDVPPQISGAIARERGAQKTGRKIDIHERNQKHLSDAYDAAKYAAKKFKWHVVDCAGGGSLFSIDEIHRRIVDLVSGVAE